MVEYCGDGILIASYVTLLVRLKHSSLLYFHLVSKENMSTNQRYCYNVLILDVPSFLCVFIKLLAFISNLWSNSGDIFVILTEQYSPS